MAREIEVAQQARAPNDRAWTLSFIAVLIAIHIGRMGTDRTLLGLISPGVAVLGDMLIAIVVTLLVIDPLYLDGASRRGGSSDGPGGGTCRICARKG
jgi:hypothetical protein